jgi:hypothetical protein
MDSQASQLEVHHCHIAALFRDSPGKSGEENPPSKQISKKDA